MNSQFSTLMLSVETIAVRERQRSLVFILWLSLIAGRQRPLPFLINVSQSHSDRTS
ncbi:MAG: hypothetical protein ACM65L_26965 [Microcoleus sp.]